MTEYLALDSGGWFFYPWHSARMPKPTSPWRYRITYPFEYIPVPDWPSYRERLENGDCDD